MESADTWKGGLLRGTELIPVSVKGVWRGWVGRCAHECTTDYILSVSTQQDANPLCSSVVHRLERAKAKVAELRELLGVAIRRQNETLAETSSLREQLRLERDRHLVLRSQHASTCAALEQNLQSASDLRRELTNLQVVVLFMQSLLDAR